MRPNFQYEGEAAGRGGLESRSPLLPGHAAQQGTHRQQRLRQALTQPGPQPQ